MTRIEKLRKECEALTTAELKTVLDFVEKVKSERNLPPDEAPCQTSQKCSRK